MKKLNIKVIFPAAAVAAALLVQGCGSAAGDTSSALSARSDASAAGSAQSPAEDGSSGTESVLAEDESESRDIFAMDTYMTVTAYGPNAKTALDDAETEILRLDALLSTGSSTSEVGEINANGGGTLSADGIALMQTSLDLYKSTGGLFDISIYPIMELWGFPTEEYRVPDASEIQNTLKKVDASKINFDADTGEVSFRMKGMKIDFGGIAKGYTSSKLMEIFAQDGVKSGLVNLGGNVQTCGAKPDGSGWRVAIQSPDENGDFLGILTETGKAVITSGGYERYFAQDGVTYHHIIDPRTGYPANNGIQSATVVSENGTEADGLSTSLFIMGVDEAEKYWRAHSDEFDMILLDDDGKLYVSEGIASNFSTSLEMEVVEYQE